MYRNKYWDFLEWKFLFTFFFVFFVLRFMNLIQDSGIAHVPWRGFCIVLFQVVLCIAYILVFQSFNMCKCVDELHGWVIFLFPFYIPFPFFLIKNLRWNLVWTLIPGFVLLCNLIYWYLHYLLSLISF